MGDGDPEKEPQDKGEEGEALAASKADDGEAPVSPKTDAKGTPRKIVNDGERAKRFGLGIVAHLGKAKKNLVQEKSSDSTKKAVDAKARVEQKLEEGRVAAREAQNALRAEKGKSFGMKGFGMKGAFDMMKGKGKGKDGKGMDERLPRPEFALRPAERGLRSDLLGLRSDGPRERYEPAPRDDPRARRDDPRRDDPRDARGRVPAGRDRERDRDEERAREKEREREKARDDEKRREKEREREKEKEEELRRMYKRLAEHYKCMGHFIRTKVEPTIFYLPATHNSKTRRLLSETEDAIQGKVRGLEAQAAAVGKAGGARREDRSRSRNRDRRR